jgi:hypothetical protein
MRARVCRSILAVTLAAACLPADGAFGPAWSAGPHQKTPSALTSAQRTEYRILQGDRETGRESVEKKVFDNNTVVFVIDAAMEYGHGVTMKQHAELTLEEESFFPRSLHVVKNVAEADSNSFAHEIDVEMYANVAVVSSALRGQRGSRRLVVPTGVAFSDLGILAYLYQMLFWYDGDVGGRQRFECLDPVAVSVLGGEIRLDGETTIPVLGKNTRVRVFKLERDKFGAATLWVDEDGTIVRGEQNLFVYELVSRKSS